MSKQGGQAPVQRAAPRGGQQLEDRPLDLPQWAGLGLIPVLVLAVFARFLFFPRGQVLSAAGFDLFHYFVHWRQFGFQELASGRLALWNPHYFSGTPFFGGFQSALLYPPNLLFLVLPLGSAINWSIALHVSLAGIFTFLWVKARGLHTLAAFLSAAMFMFSGPYFLHIYAGHLPNLCTMPWAPLLFLALDKIFARPSLGPCLLGIFAASMALLAGHIQYVFYLALAAGIYSLLNFIHVLRPGAPASLPAHDERNAGSPLTRHSSPVTRHLPFLPCLAAICLGTAALTAVQLFTGVQEAGETLRSSGVSYKFASSFSFAPENFLTLIAPWFFGDMRQNPYWGRCYLPEMSLFVSLTGLVLAVFGAARGPARLRRFSITLVLLSLVLALGAHTPLFHFLYSFVPGFNKFRGNSKFIFLTSLFLAMLAGIGLDRLLKSGRAPRGLIGGALAAGALLCATALWLSHATMAMTHEACWPSFIRAIQQTGEIFQQAGVPTSTFAGLAFSIKAGGIACKSLLLGGASLLALSLLLFLSNHSRRWQPAILALALVELWFFARGSLASFPRARTTDPQVARVLADNPGDYRILNLRNPDSSLSLGALDAWGDDPGGLRRSAQFLAFSQGIPPGEVTQYIPITNIPPAFSMLRCRFVFPSGAGARFYETTTPPLPRALLVEHCRVLTNRDLILSALTSADFNPREVVILEPPPDPYPQPALEKGTVPILDTSTDDLTIEAHLKSPAILLITDSYSRHWRVRPLPGTAQSHYQILPANYCLRAVPLAAGEHRFRLEYAPLGFRIGKWVSLFSLAIFLALVGLVLRRPRPPGRWRTSFPPRVRPARLSHRQVGLPLLPRHLPRAGRPCSESSSSSS